MPVDYVNAQFLNVFVGQVRPKAVAFEKWALKLNGIAQADQDMDDQLEAATDALYKNAKAARERCDAIATLMGITFPDAT